MYDERSKTAQHYAAIKVLGQERQALADWWGALPRDRLLTKDEIRPLYRAQLHVIMLCVSREHTDIVYLEHLHRPGEPVPAKAPSYSYRWSWVDRLRRWLAELLMPAIGRRPRE